MTLDTLESTS